MWHRLFTDPLNWRLALFAFVPTIALAWLAGSIARRLMTGVMRSLLGGNLTTRSPVIRAPLRLIEIATFVLVLGVLIVPALEAVGLHPRAGVHLRTLSAWAFDSGLRVLLIVAVSFALIRMVAVWVRRFEHDVNFGSGLDALERAKRARTLGGVLSNITTAVVLVIAALMLLREFGVDTSPALTGAGVIGVALGFGAQNLIKDVIAGFFLILENQVRVGDVAIINGTGGLVEAINLRTIILRDEEGTVHVFPNGGITTLANRSKDFSYYVLNLPLAYGENVDAMLSLLRQIADGMCEEDRYKPFILAPLEVIGVDGFDENAIRVKFRIKTAPLKQWEVGRELRKRVTTTFQQRDIYMWGHHSGPPSLKR
ncbi:MAG TPA: mechanosensitive ion channel family protein [Vicinamibacterales bacterium]|jgi:small conductance mechanosensitive channel